MKKPILYIFLHFVHFVHVHLAKIWWPCTKMELDPPLKVSKFKITVSEIVSKQSVFKLLQTVEIKILYIV